MREVMATANLVESEALESGSSITAVLPRHELEAASRGGDSLGLWFDIANEKDEEVMRLTVEMSSADAHEALRLSKDDEMAFALDGQSLKELYDGPEVEAHGMRGALAIAVTASAIAAPASLAANPQVASTALKPQVAHTALKPQVARTALKAQVANRDVTRQVIMRLVVTAAGVNAWH